MKSEIDALKEVTKQRYDQENLLSVDLLLMMENTTKTFVFHDTNDLIVGLQVISVLIDDMPSYFSDCMLDLTSPVLQANSLKYNRVITISGFTKTRKKSILINCSINGKL